tara:strand:+ start:1256 stop:1702 length:447 start_codon:yes stop_codon:yes gene_type:complete
MKVILILFFILLLNCSTQIVSKNHGISSLDKKYNKITIKESNKNDIIELIGPPSVISMFDENTWFYIERKKTNQSLSSLGKKKIQENNVLLVKFNNIGILSEKKFIDKSKMNKLKFAENVTQKEFKKNNFLFNIFTSMREKMNSASKK